ncbi:MAG: DUF2171 domain-containing protein [Chloroflexia bacterium]|nr:DUF2171 domain-containing protein [Chloroflexia bacterium]
MSMEGSAIIGLDGENVGMIVAVHQTYVIVRNECPFPTDYYIPTSAVSNREGDKLQLDVTKDQALARAPFRVWLPEAPR